MRYLYLTIFFLVFFNLQILAKEEMFDDPVDLTPKKGCDLNEYCEKYIQDINIEEFIKKEMKKDYKIISLDECIDITLKNNFNIDINYHKYKSSDYEYKNALSNFLPILNTTSYISDYQGQILVGGVLYDKFHETAISVNITAKHNLTNGGRDIFNAKAKNYLKKSKKHTYNYSKSEALYYSSKYYYELLLAKMHIRIYLRNLIERNAQLSLAQNLANSGLGTKFDVIRSKSESQYAKAKLLQALYNFRTAQSNLANVMGIEIDTYLMPFEKDVKELNIVNVDNIDVDKVFKLALKNREDLASIKNKINYEKEQKNVLMTEFFPKPYVSFQQQFQGTFNIGLKPNYIMSAYLTWQPGENLVFGTLSKIQAKKEEIKSMKLDLENKLRYLQMQLVNNISAIMFAKRGIKITKDRVEYSKESIKLAMLRFNFGKGILLDVIQAQSEATQARVEYAETVIQYNISQLSLLFNNGTIERELIINNYNP